ncbi:MAG TPA: class I SAM-dependent methyltransferase, partial [Thermoanaerobaculia bacterium]|nr:class I SAM-dependent methyltransferase [Thermoanaerobaculia bacterium]
MRDLLVPARIDTPELLDEGGEAPSQIERSLRDLRRFNRWAGGTAAYRRLLRKMVRGLTTPLTVLDLGTGTFDLLDSLPTGVLKVGADIRLEHLLYGRRAGRRTRSGSVRAVVADAFHLPFADCSVDVVTSSHFFHHFSPVENRRILEESLRVSRIGVAVTDTRR